MLDVWTLAAILSKLALYITVIWAMGLLVIRLAFSNTVRLLHERMRVRTAFLAGLALIASLSGYLLRGAALTGDASGMTDPEILGLLWQTPVGDALVYRIMGLGLMITGLFIPRIGQWVALAGGLVALWSFTRIGHIPELMQPGIALLLLVHLLVATYWIGVLEPLHYLARKREHLKLAAELGHRFGQIAMVVVPALIVAGLVMAWLLLGGIEPLFSTPYGQALLIKVGFVGCILAIAAANKLRLIPAMQSGNAQAAQHLTRSIEIEALAMLLVLAVTATLTSLLTLPT